MKGSVFVLKLHSFRDFIGCFGNVMLDKGAWPGRSGSAARNPREAEVFTETDHVL